MAEIDLELSNNEVPQNKAILILIGSVLLGIIFDLLFFEKIPGISGLLFVFSFYIFFLFYFKRNLSLRFDISNILIIFIFLLASTYAVFSNPIFMILNIIAIPFLVGVQTIITTKNNHYNWYEIRFLNDVAYNVLFGSLAYIFKPLELIKSLVKINSNTEKYSNLKKVLIGFVISLPLLFIVIGLLSSADEVFKNLINNLSNVFIGFKVNSLVLQIILILIIALLLFSYIWNLSLSKHREKPNLIDSSRAKYNFIDPVILITILIMICLVYLLFNIIQFTYLFGSIGASPSLPASLTYAEYARRGFWELLAVTLINLTILVTNIKFSNNKQTKIHSSIKLLNTILIFFTIIMLFSAHFRMSLYEEVYGYTYLRIFTHSFMLYILGLLLITLTRVWYNKLSLLKYFLVISLVAYTVLNFANVDSLIAKNNINRYHKTGKLDVSYLTSLSYEAAPQLITLLEELKIKKEPSTIQLENSLYHKQQLLKQWNSWKSYNFSISNAKKLFKNYHFKYKQISDPDNYIE